MKVDITIPDDYLGDVIGDVNARRGRILGMEASESQAISTRTAVPDVRLYDIFAFWTQGRGTFVMQISHTRKFRKFNE